MFFADEGSDSGVQDIGCGKCFHIFLYSFFLKKGEYSCYAYPLFILQNVIYSF